jgi:cell wall-associated NlpC family hydrolase
MTAVPPALSPLAQKAIDEARSWLSTPYAHMGRRKGVGCDCATLIAEVFERAGLIPRVEVETYPPYWHLHRGEELYMNEVLRHADELDPRKSPPRPADLVLWRYGRTYSHGAIVVEWPAIIEAHLVRGVILNSAGEHAGKRLKLYRLKALGTSRGTITPSAPAPVSGEAVLAGRALSAEGRNGWTPSP